MNINKDVKKPEDDVLPLSEKPSQILPDFLFICHAVHSQTSELIRLQYKGS